MLVFPKGNLPVYCAVGASNEKLAQRWVSAGANCLFSYGDQKRLVEIAENLGVGYALRVHTVQHMQSFIDSGYDPAFWWVLPDEWPSKHGDEPITWGAGGKADIAFLKTFLKVKSNAPVFVYTPGHYSNVNGVQKAIRECADVGCAALYDESYGYAPSFAVWRLQETTHFCTYAVADCGIDDRMLATGKRLNRNLWLSVMCGAKGLLLNNVARAKAEHLSAFRDFVAEHSRIWHVIALGRFAKSTFDGELISGMAMPTFECPPVQRVWQYDFRLAEEFASIRVDLVDNSVSIKNWSTYGG